jgi:hypothetical protein
MNRTINTVIKKVQVFCKRGASLVINGDSVDLNNCLTQRFSGASLTLSFALNDRFLFCSGYYAEILECLSDWPNLLCQN